MSSKHERLLTFYSQTLDAVDVKVNEDGALVYMPPDAVEKDGSPMRTPARLDGKQWILPTKEVLNDSPWEDHIAFHPLSENILNGESTTLTNFKALANIKLNTIVANLMLHLTEFAANPAAHANAPAKASKFLKLVPNINETTLKHMKELYKRSDASVDRRFISLYIKKGGRVSGNQYPWATIVSFPFRHELDGEQGKAFGVSFSKKDQASFKALFEYILPESDDLQSYSAGGTSHTAPKFESFLKAFVKVATQLNEIVTAHKKILPTYKNLLIDLEWVETLGEVDKLADVVPPLPGNVGDPARDSRAESGAKATPTHSTAKAQRVFSQPATPREAPAREVREEVRTEAPARAVAEERMEDVAGETFAQRMERQSRAGHMRENQSRYGQRQEQAQSTRYGARQYGPRKDEVPTWAEEQEKGGTGSRVVAGHDPKNQPQGPQYGSRQQGGPVGSFSERMSGRGSNYGGNRGGGYGQNYRV